MGLLNNKKIGERLRDHRFTTNKSSRKYAIDARVDPSQYAKIEKGKLPITDVIMEKLVGVYGLNKDDILYGKDLGTNVPRGIEQAEPLKATLDTTMLMQAVLNLTESNKILAANNEKLVNRLGPNSGGSELIS